MQIVMQTNRTGVPMSRGATIASCSQNNLWKSAFGEKKTKIVKKIAQFAQDHALGGSLFGHYESLPEEGKVISDKDRFCDPEEGRCGTKMYVYESKCEKCSGSGIVTVSGTSTWGHRKRRGHSRGHVRLGTCAACSGVGYVRRATMRFDPLQLSTTSDEVITAARSPIITAASQKPPSKVLAAPVSKGVGAAAPAAAAPSVPTSNEVEKDGEVAVGEGHNNVVVLPSQMQRSPKEKSKGQQTSFVRK